jgi:protein-disulfide isomerase
MTLLRTTFISLLTAASFSQAAYAQTPTPAAANASAPVTRGEIPALVKEALMNEPEIIMEVAKKLRDKQEEAAKNQALQGLQKHQSDLFNNPDSPAIGAENADVVIVEFFDYHCGYCKHMLPVINDLMKDDKKVRFIFKEFPILSEDSVLAARVALAVNRVAKDKYFAFHQELMNANVKFEEKMLLDTVKKIGVDVAKVKAEMAKPEITAILDKNREIAGALGISGTPAIVMGDNITPGAVDLETLKRMVASYRESKNKPAVANNPAEASGSGKQ